ncbi:hypothetical protein [Novosphingobium sp. Chol11]|uniref:hypothetical protein n=1 Tax=Novosphingobium sp. Chol11 TaxID=1385763 RepID=UPI000BE2E6D4|nr:hypothetical protein [Novosphingobium sp. Chol11]
MPIKKSADAWRSEGRRAIGVVITDAGRAGIAVEVEKPELSGAPTLAPVTAPNVAPSLPEQFATTDAVSMAPVAHTKTALVLQMLGRESGATLGALTGATHSIDKRKRGEVTCYHLGSQA